MKQSGPAPFGMRVTNPPANVVAGVHLHKIASPHQARAPSQSAISALEESSQQSNLGGEPGLQVASGAVESAARVASFDSLTLSSSDQIGLDEKPPRLLVFSGGTAFNSVAGKLRKLTTLVSHILPVSDDGGSTAEIVRVLGGPAVGDIRSRCVRLADDSNPEAHAVCRLLRHRLCSTDQSAAEREWQEIVQGGHSLWEELSEPYKHTIRAFLVYFHTQILRVSTKFDFRHGSIGNFFFAGARVFFRSLDAAIFLFSRVTRIPEGSQVLPSIQTEERITLAAELEDGTFIRGQSQISHPVDGIQSPAINKFDDGPSLVSPIRRVFYLSSGGTIREHEVSLQANIAVLAEVEKSNAIIYGMGSLYTSICPSLILNGMGEAISAKNVPKILIVNGQHDRETSSCRSHSGPMRASDIIRAVCDALNRRHSRNQSLENPPSAYITHIIVPMGGTIPVDKEAVHELGVEHVVEARSLRNERGRIRFVPDDLIDVMSELIGQ